MNKKLILGFLLTITFTQIYAQNSISNEYEICNFYRNPFKNDKTIPTITETLQEITEIIGSYSKKEETVKNIHNNKQIDKKIFLENSNYYVYYYYSSYKKEFYLQLFQIRSDKKLLKKDVKIGMNEIDIIELFGPDFSKNYFENNYELVYQDKFSCPGSVNFSFTNDKKLSAINLWNSL